MDSGAGEALIIVKLTYTEIGYLLGICEKDMEEEAISFLAHSLSRKYKEASRERAEYKATVRAVRAINHGENKGIETLCDIDSK